MTKEAGREKGSDRESALTDGSSPQLSMNLIRLLQLMKSWEVPGAFHHLAYSIDQFNPTFIVF